MCNSIEPDFAEMLCVVCNEPLGTNDPNKLQAKQISTLGDLEWVLYHKRCPRTQLAEPKSGSLVKGE